MSDHANQTIEAEVQRLQCLQALGIAVYHPRFRLPGAKPSVHGIWPAAELASQSVVSHTAPTHSAVPQHGEPAPQPAPQRAPQRVEVPVTPVKPVRPAAREPASVSPAPVPRTESAPDTVQKFQLLFLQIDDELALVNQIPALARPQLQDKQLALLANLLRWLGKSVPAQTPRMFRWPLPGIEHLAGSMSAQTSLLHFLEQARSERAFRYLLQLGPQAVAPASNDWQAYTTHSLDEMLALPALKREVWETLLPLHALLHAGSSQS